MEEFQKQPEGIDINLAGLEAMVLDNKTDEAIVIALRNIDYLKKILEEELGEVTTEVEFDSYTDIQKQVSQYESFVAQYRKTQ